MKGETSADKWSLVLPSLLAGLLAAVLVAAAAEVIYGLLSENHLERQRAETLQRLSTLRARLEGEINSTLHLTRGLIAYVATHPQVEREEFDVLASEIVSVGRNIRNIGLARDNVITHMFPMAGNEAALGLEYEKQPAQWPAVKRAMELRGTVLAGPVKLIQGGTAFIARTPIYTRGTGVGGHLSEHRPAYWGIASIVIDLPPLFRAAEVAEETDGVRIAIRGRDGMGAEGEPIFGNESLFGQEPVFLSVLFPNGSWQIAGLPKAGWGGDVGPIWLLRLVGWLTALVIGLLIGALVRARLLHRELALHDHLTGLPNRRLLDDRFDQMIARVERNGGLFGMLYIDLDGFKAVNDLYGHKVGDGLLVEVAHRMRANVRNVDTVARVGGDEFIVLADAMDGYEALGQLAKHLEQNLQGSVFVEGHRLELQASVGRALFPEDGQTLDELMKTADRKMYAVKRSHKVRLVEFGGK